MRSKWGLFVHFLPDAASATTLVDMTVDAWNRRVEAFDVESFARRAADLGAAWVGFTIGQNSGYYCSPNLVYDGIVGRTPSRLSTRDLLGDLATALQRRGIRTIAYLPSHAPVNDPQAVYAFRCLPLWRQDPWGMRPEVWAGSPPDSDARLTHFQQRWESVVAHWSQRWAGLVSAWWFDGCYFAREMYAHPDAPNFASFAAAARDGNPHALVAMNAGVAVPVKPIAESDEDYTAGELSGALPLQVQGKWPQSPDGGSVDGRQLHHFTYLGPWWGAGTEPRMPDDLAAGFTELTLRAGGAMTWDVPVGMYGDIPQPIVRQLAAIRDGVRQQG